METPISAAAMAMEPTDFQFANPPREYDTKNGFGYACIVSMEQYKDENYRLTGSEAKCLKVLLPHCGFQVAPIERNLSREKFKEFLELDIKTEVGPLSVYKSFLLIVIGHGIENGVLTTDERHQDSLDYDYIISQVAENKALVRKPKWIIFLCCRGKKEDAGHTKNPNTRGPPWMTLVKSIPVPTYSDLLVSYATTFGYVSSTEAQYGGNGELVTNWDVTMAKLSKLLKQWIVAASAKKDKPAERLYVLDLLIGLNFEFLSFSDNDTVQMPQHSMQLTERFYLYFRKKPEEELKLWQERLASTIASNEDNEDNVVSQAEAPSTSVNTQRDEEDFVGNLSEQLEIAARFNSNE